MDPRRTNAVARIYCRMFQKGTFQKWWRPGAWFSKDPVILESMNTKRVRDQAYMCSVGMCIYRFCVYILYVYYNIYIYSYVFVYVNIDGSRYDLHDR